MKLRSLIAGLALFGAAATSGVASAQTLAIAAYDGTTNMRAGPGTNYPVIARILAGSRVNVIGCLTGYSWCDVVVQNYRGWVSTTRLQFAYEARRQTPIIGFSFDYWDRHYSHWDFYRDWRRRNRPHDWDGGNWNGGNGGGNWNGGGHDWDGGNNGGNGGNGGWTGGSGGNGGWTGGNGGNGGNGGWTGGSGGDGGNGGLGPRSAARSRSDTGLSRPGPEPRRDLSGPGRRLGRRPDGHLSAIRSRLSVVR